MAKCSRFIIVIIEWFFWVVFIRSSNHFFSLTASNHACLKNSENAATIVIIIFSIAHSAIHSDLSSLCVCSCIRYAATIHSSTINTQAMRFFRCFCTFKSLIAYSKSNFEWRTLIVDDYIFFCWSVVESLANPTLTLGSFLFFPIGWGFVFLNRMLLCLRIVSKRTQVSVWWWWFVQSHWSV